MKKFRLTPQNLNLLLAIGGVLIFVAVYFLVFQNFSAKNDELDNQIESRGQYLSELEYYNENVDEYERGAKEYKSQIDGLVARLPAKLENEDIVLFFKNLHDSMGLQLPAISFAAPVLVSEFTTTVNDKLVNAQGFVTGASFSTKMTYAQLKQYIDKIYDPASPVSFLDNISVTYDSSDASLGVSTSVSRYYMSYDGAEYVPYPSPNVSIGTANFFQTKSAPEKTTKD